MRHLLILGAGTAGTIMANRLARLFETEYDTGAIRITIVDQDPEHIYQPGLLFVPFGTYRREHVVRGRHAQVNGRVRYIQSRIARLDAIQSTVELSTGETLAYDVLVIATGSRLAPEETEGMLDAGWQENVFDFYTLSGAEALARALPLFTSGRLVVNVVEMPIKCPVAPLEFAFLADAYFRQRGVRDRIEIVYATPLEGAFTKPACTTALTHLLDEKDIRLETEFNTGRVDAVEGKLVSWDDREVPFDLLVTVPLHKGADFLEQVPGLTNDQGFVLTHPRTLQSRLAPNIFAIGDATDLPASKAGSVAHFESEVLTENIARFLGGQPLVEGFDGHASCFIETGFDKALLIDFNYEVEPLPGNFPFAWGPMPLLKESRINHLGKLAFRHVYWNALLPGVDLPGMTSQMPLAGKVLPSHLTRT